MKIYLVTGSCGSYSDASEWPVKAYGDQARAEAFAESLPGILKDLLQVQDEDHVAAVKSFQERADWYAKSGHTSPPWGEPDPVQAARNRACEAMRQLHDPSFGSDPDTSWSVTEIELEL